MEPREPHSSSPPPLVLPHPYVSEHISRGDRSGLSPKPPGKADMSRSHGYSSSRPVRQTTDDFPQRDRSIRGPQAKTSRTNNGSSTQGKIMGKNSLDAQKRGFRGLRSASNSAGKSKPTQNDLVPFEVKMSDFPELGGVLPGKAGSPHVQKEGWAPSQTSTTPQMQTLASAWKSGMSKPPAHAEPQQPATHAKPDSSASSPGQTVATSWASVASQPPKQPVPKEKTISSNQMQTEDTTAQHEVGAPGKKKQKKKKKKAEYAEAEAEDAVIYREPPKFEDEKEFPGLTLASTRTSRNAATLYSEENQRKTAQQTDADQILNKEKPSAAETVKKGQKAEKVSGKKSKAPVQLDIGNILAALEKKQHPQKPKQDAKPVILSVGGGLPIVQKQVFIQKKPPWQKDKIAHNPLDSTSPLVKKGKQREVPKAKKPTPLKKVILKEREERKQRRLLEERGLLPEDEFKPVNEAAEEEQCDTNPTDDIESPTEELDDQSEFNGTNQMVKQEEETDTDEIVTQQTTSPVSCAVSHPKIHSRKFRDYCSQMLSRDVDQCVTALLKELVRFQDRLYQKDPMKARMKRRLVMGLREVLKHLKLRKVKCVIISPNCERIQSKGGLDEALHTIIDTCREQGVPFVFALSRKALGRCVNKAVPVSLVGIFNYDGAQDYYHKMIELSSEARTAYEVMVTSLEQPDQDQAEAELEMNREKELQINSLGEQAEPCPDSTQSEEPEYIKIWKKILEKNYNQKCLNFEEQLGSMHLDSECTENTDDEKS
uniref:Ribosomal protein eL8/eL30/eS12/Gadd45 domain-containing protein n=1 Tax=Monopterus albus TaxID=43700 RepID=A0A3Q3Q8H7_MONAL|nr:selenocysteine insertion sequence-binding protein 2 [Monopterus albus]